MSKYIFRLLVIAAFIVPVSLSATHIVGGEIGYECLGGGDYAIVLDVYRDCSDPSNAGFDDFVYVGIYDQNNVLVEQINIPFMGTDTITTIITDPCLVIVEEVCVETATYRGEVNLPFLAGGYTIAYQRCCRNETLENILVPLETGATYDIHLNEEAMASCNTSPQFTEWPAIYICADQELRFDHSAFDPEGDSLVYSLCTPFVGGSLTTPRPDPASPPPYDTVVWSPGFALEDMLGTGSPLTINPSTGLLVVTPGTIGQYVVGICVEEYDAATGELLSMTRRDFQYNVVVCGEKAAALAAPEAQCDDLTVTIENQSTNSTAYEWCFDYPTCDSTMISDTTALTFDWIFPDTGTYTIRLIAEPNSLCADTVYREIFLQDNSLAADYQIEVFDCDNFASLALMDLSTDNVSPPVAWFWSITYGNPAITDTSTMQNPIFILPLNTIGTMDFTVTSQNGCMQSLADTFETGTSNPADLLLTDVEVCVGDAVFLNPNTPVDINYTYQWSPAALLDNPTAVNPEFQNILATTTFSVTITPANNACEIIREMTVTAVPLPELDFTTHLECDGLTITFTNLSTNVDTTAYVWDFGEPSSGQNTSTLKNPTHTYNDLGMYTVTLSVADTELCTDMITKEVVIDAIELNADFSIQYASETCSEDSVVVQLFDESTNTSMSPIDSWEWTLVPGGTLTGPNPTFTVFSSQLTDITLTIMTADGCSTSMAQNDVDITIVDNSNQFQDTLIVCNGGSSQLLPGGNTDYTYLWSPDIGIDDVTSASPTFSPDVTTTYTVLVSHIGIDTCENVEEVLVFVTPAINLQVNGDGVICEEQVTLTASTDVPTIITWLDATGTELETGETYTFDVSGIHDITVNAIDIYDCEVEERITVSGGPVDVSIPDTAKVCLGEMLNVSVTNLDASDTLTYSWTPIGAFEPGTANDANPDVIEVIGEQTIYVTVENQFGCTYMDSVAIAVIDVNLQVSGDGITCEEQVTLTASTAVTSIISWLDATTGTVLETGGTYTFDVSGIHDIIVNAIDGFGCEVEERITVSGGPVDVTVPDTVAICLGEILNVAVTNLDASDTLTYSWTPIDAFESGTANDANPDVIEVIGEQTIYVTVENQFGCTYMDSVAIAVIDDNITLSFTSEVQCDGTTVIFTNTSVNGCCYVWDFGDGSPLNYEESPTHNYSISGAGDYTVTLSLVYDVSCGEPATEIVTVLDPEVIADFDYDIIECSPDSAVIALFDQSVSVFTIVSWDWQPFGVTDQNPIDTVTESGEIEITLTITTSNGCVSSVSQTIDIQLVELSLQDTIILCRGDSTELNPGGNPTQTYSWTPTGSLDDPTSANPTAFPDATTTYTVEVYTVGSDTCVYTDEIVVFVPGDINLDLSDDIITCGESVTITPTTSVGATIMWSSALEGDLGTSPTITINPFIVDTIFAKATDQYGCMDTDTLIITDQGVDITGFPTEITACASIDTTITVMNADPDDILTYEWTPVEFITGPTDQATVTFNVPVDCVTFSCLITNQYGCDTTIMTTVCVVPFEVVVPDTVWVCPGGTPPGLNPDGDASYTYEWSPADNLTATDIANPLYTGQIPGTYVYTVTIFDNALGVNCETTEEVVVIVNPIIGLETMGDTTLCEIVPVELSASTNAGISATISWYQGDPLVLFNTGSPITVTPEEGENIYTAIALDENTGCLDTGIVIVQVNILENGIPDSIVYVCPNIPTPINPGGDSLLIYTWEPITFLDISNPWNPIVTTNEEITYIVTIEDPIGNCFLMDTVTVIPHPEINPVAAPDTTICEFIEIELTATGSVGPLDYIWFSDAEMNNEIGAGSPITVSPQGTEVYYVMATDEFGCSEKDSIQVDAYPIQATINAPVVICESTDTEILTVNNNGPEEIITYEWTPNIGDGPEVIAPLTGTDNNFCVDLTNEYGCEETLCTEVTVIDLIDSLSIIAIPDTILLGDNSVITVGGCFACNFEWTWTSGDIIPLSGPVITVTPSEAGDNFYEVEASLLGCVESTETLVYVIEAICDDSHVFIPTSFSPNGDGHNDVLQIYSSFKDEITEMELMIYNRWGEEVFRTTDIYQAWDGTYQGKDLTPDVYGFYLRTLCPEGEELIQKGNITLLR